MKVTTVLRSELINENDLIVMVMAWEIDEF